MASSSLRKETNLNKMNKAQNVLRDDTARIKLFSLSSSSLLSIVNRITVQPSQSHAPISMEMIESLAFCINQFAESCSANLPLDGVKGKMKALVLVSWYRLNCGRWIDIDDSWRQFYGKCVSFSALLDYWTNMGEDYDDDHDDDDDASVKQLIRQFDNAILMGGPLIEQSLREAICILESMLKSVHAVENNHNRFEHNSLHTFSIDFPLQKEACPSLETFKRKYFLEKKPVLLTDCIDHWPAMQLWTFEYFLNRIGNRLVPIEIGNNYADTKWTQKLMTFREFYENHLINCEDNNVTIGYLAQHQLLNQIPSLANDVRIPDYCVLGEKSDVDFNIWIGPKNTISPLHQDPKANFLCQIKGRKFVRLIDTSFRDRVYPFDSSLISNTSEVDVLNPDYERFPLFKDVPFVDCILNPGTMLYIPPGYWHYVQSLSASVSLSVWFE